MDTTKLKVGQDVYMISGISGATGRVIRVTPEGVDVAAYGLPYSDILTEVFHFNRKAIQAMARGKAVLGNWTKCPSRSARL